MVALLPVIFLSLNLSIIQGLQEPPVVAPDSPAPVVAPDSPAPEEKETHLADPASLLEKPSPALVLDDIDGNPFDLSNHSEDVVVLEWTLPECRFSQRLYSQHRVTPMIRRWGKQGVKWVSIDSAFFAHPEKIRPWLKKFSVEHPYLIDLNGRLAEAFGVKVSPTYLVVNRGQIVYHGAIDDDVWGKKLERKLYLDMAIRDAVEGRTVQNPLTRPYGMVIRTRRVEDERRARIQEAREARERDEKNQSDSTSQGSNTGG